MIAVHKTQGDFCRELGKLARRPDKVAEVSYHLSEERYEASKGHTMTEFLQSGPY